ncbi:MAG TPA: outer membrane lipoprotein carrier protein LolA [Flavipsychrobacter sp.]|nr:outer membrane lipoprotein carrier protein LolA [Flavipsychrobacter sp.]
MNKLFTTLLFVTLATGAFAQPKGFTAIKNAAAFQTSLSKANSTVKTISSDFSQTKNMALLSEKIKSKGKFYFMKEDKVRIEYTSPYTYLLVMNKGQILVKDEQKTTKISTRNSKAMQSVNRIMMDCMRGTVLSNPDFKATVYENSGSYLVSLSPNTADMKKMFQDIEVYLSKGSFDVNRLVMKENGGDLTDMLFTNTLHNAALNESLFKVK